jgi:hypothetical protein
MISWNFLHPHEEIIGVIRVPSTYEDNYSTILTHHTVSPSRQISGNGSAERMTAETISVGEILSRSLCLAVSRRNIKNATGYLCIIHRSWETRHSNQQSYSTN